MGVSIKQKSRRELMTQAAVELLENHGLNSMTVRKITTKIGMSSIAIYTEFGSMQNLVASVVDYSFLQLLQKFHQLPNTENVLSNIWNAVCAVRDFSLAHPNLYAVMFAVENIGGYKRSGSELQQGIETLRFIHNLCMKAVEEKIFSTSSRNATHQIWVTMHGRLMLERSGYLSNEKEILRSYAFLISTSMIGLGAKVDLVDRAIQINAEN